MTVRFIYFGNKALYSFCYKVSNLSVIQAILTTLAFINKLKTYTLKNQNAGVFSLLEHDRKGSNFLPTTLKWISKDEWMDAGVKKQTTVWTVSVLKNKLLWRCPF